MADTINITLDKDEQQLLIDSIEAAITITDWDSYDSENYENPEAQISWMNHLICKAKGVE